MTEEEKKKEAGEISRRQFLAGAGLVVGGAAIGAAITYPLVPGKEVEVPKYVCPYDSLEFTTFDALVAHVAAVHPEVTPPTVEAVTTLTVNGKVYKLVDVKPSWSLAWVLREKLGLPGTKTGCNRGDCGTCTVVMNGKAVYSCLVLAVEAEGANIVTIEGLSDGITLTGIQKAMYDEDSEQCGFCSPGFIMAGQALLAAKPKPTLDEVREALSGHICTCGNTKMFVDAVLKV